MEGLLLTIAGDGPEGPVLPRRASLALRPGDGALDLGGVPSPDAVWQASIGAAWEAAKRLAGRRDADARLEVRAGGAMRGASAGLTVGLLALGALLGTPLPPFFATGGITDPDGFVAGGRAAQAKAEAAAQLAPQLHRRAALFLAPPLPEPPRVALAVALAADLGSALARLDPDTYARVAAAHRRLRAAPEHPRGPFARVRADPAAPPLPASVGGIAVESHAVEGLGAGAWVDVGEDSLVLWRVQVPAASLPAALPGLLELARRAAVR